MASFTPSKKTASDFNGGVEYQDQDLVNNIQGDYVQAATVNNLVESALYTQDEADGAVTAANNAVTIANDAMDKINEAISGTVVVNGTYPDMTVGKSTNSDKAAQLTTGRAIDGITFNATSAITHFCTSSTSSSTAAKTASLAGFVLTAGARVTIKFTYANTVNSPTLNINGTGAKGIKADGDTTYVKWIAGAVIDFVYDGTYWVCMAGYPLQGKRVGCYYESNNSTPPSTLYGGSWTQVKDRCLVGAGNLYSGGSTGGSADAVVVEHEHEEYITNSDSSQYIMAYEGTASGAGIYGVYVSAAGATSGNTGVPVTTQTVGASGIGKNMPPYMAAYLWYRYA